MLALGTGGAGGCCLLQWKVPAHLVHRTYHDLVIHLIGSCNAVPLGLLRTLEEPSSHPAEKQSVLAAPPPHLQLLADDLVFVFGATET